MSLTLFGLSYAGILLYDTTVQTLLQIVVPDRMRGRVLGFRSMSWGVVWLLGFLTGAIAEAIGAPATIVLGGGVVVATAAMLYNRIARIGENGPAGAVVSGRSRAG